MEFGQLYDVESKPPNKLILLKKEQKKRDEGSEDVPDDLLPFTEGRGRQERRDSLTLHILQERKIQSERIKAFPVDGPLKNELEDDGFGQKKRLQGYYEAISEVYEDYTTGTAAGGHSMFLGSFKMELPEFDHLLPEIAMLGHSNTGKSTLVNALIGVLPRTGPAGVSDRAGWTNRVYYYRLGRKPPVMTLVDFPGYGFAVADENQKLQWQRMTKLYLKYRLIMTKCCILIDSQRGLCREDRQLLKYVSKLNLPWVVLLTKTDLLSSDDLVRTIYSMKQDLLPYQIKNYHASRAAKMSFEELSKDPEYQSYVQFDYKHPKERIWPISASTGAGITKFWKMMNSWVQAESAPFIGEKHVREHKLAMKMRREHRSRLQQ
eukprot:gene13256-14559_t